MITTRTLVFTIFTPLLFVFASGEVQAIGSGSPRRSKCYKTLEDLGTPFGGLKKMLPAAVPLSSMEVATSGKTEKFECVNNCSSVGVGLPATSGIEHEFFNLIVVLWNSSVPYGRSISISINALSTGSLEIQTFRSHDEMNDPHLVLEDSPKGQEREASLLEKEMFAEFDRLQRAKTLRINGVEVFEVEYGKSGSSDTAMLRLFKHHIGMSPTVVIEVHMKIKGEELQLRIESEPDTSWGG